MSQCLGAAGWKATVTWDGGLSWNTPPSQSAAFNKAYSKCNNASVKYFPDVKLSPLGEKAAYAAELKNRSCIVGLGWAMPEAPSLQSYLDKFAESRWYAVADFQALIQDRSNQEKIYKSVLTKCPPPSWY